MQSRVDTIVEQLHNNNTTFYELILGNQPQESPEENLKLTMLAMRKYFSEADIKALAVEQAGSTVRFDNTKNTYLSHVLTHFFRNAGLNTAKDLMKFMNSNEDASDDLITNLYNTILIDEAKITADEQRTNLQSQIIARGKYTRESLAHFMPEQDSEAILRKGFTFAFNFKYTPGHMLLEDEVKYLSWTLEAIIARLTNEALQNIPGSHSILNIDLRNQGDDRNYFSFEHNLKIALMALQTTACLEAPAYFICSNGDHWATVALVPIGKKLHIFKFDSNGTSMADDFIIELSSLIEGTKLFEVETCMDLSQQVQYDMNCGVASASFISVLNSLLGSKTKRSIEDVITEFPGRYANLGIDPNNKKESTEKLINESLYYGLGLLSDIKDWVKPLFNYERKHLYFNRLDLSGKRRDLCNLLNSLTSNHTPKDKEQGSLGWQFLHMCCTIIAFPINTIIAFCEWIAFKIYFAISEEPLRAAANKFCNVYGAWAQKKGVELDTDRLFSPDLQNLTNQHGI